METGEYKLRHGVCMLPEKSKTGYEKEKQRKKTKKRRMQGRNRLGGCRMAQPLFSGPNVAESVTNECTWCSRRYGEVAEWEKMLSKCTADPVVA